LKVLVVATSDTSLVLIVWLAIEPVKNFSHNPLNVSILLCSDYFQLDNN